MISFSLTNGAFGKDADGNAVTGIGYDFSNISYTVGAEGEDSINLSFDGDEGENPWASIGVDFSGSFEFNVGLRGEVWVDLGHMDTALEIAADDFVVDGVANEAATLDTSGFTVETFEIDPVGFNLAESYISLGLGATLTANLTASAHGSYDFGILGEGSFDADLFQDQDINVDFTYWMIPDLPQITFDTLGGLDGNIYKFELGDYVEISIDVPEFEYEEPEYIANEDGGIDTVHITGESSPFMSLEIGVAKFILPPGIGPFGFDIDFLGDLLGESFEDYLTFAIEGGMFDAKLIGTASIGQDITVSSEVTTEIVTSLGETLTGKLGDEFTFTTPEGEGEFTVTATYTLNQTVEAITSLILNSQIDWRALFLQLEAKVDLGLIFSDTLEGAIAMFEDTVDLGELLGLTQSFELYNDTTTYHSEAGEEEYTIRYENFVTSASGAILTLTTNQDDVVGGDIDNTITGNIRDNAMRGMKGDDIINGGDGRDRLSGGQGADDMDGGDGLDAVIYRASRSGVTVDLGSGMGLDGDAEGDTITGVEIVVGSDHDDTLTGDDNANILMGFAGKDNLNGKAGRDILDGGAGADVIDGGRGGDLIRFRFDSGGVTVNLATGTGQGGDAEGDTYISIERVRGTDNDDVLTGTDSDNHLFGADGIDIIDGGDGDDVINGGAGADVLTGGLGSDTLDYRGSVFGVSVDLLYETAVDNDAAGDTFNGFENINGSDREDVLGGDDLGNILNGGTGADTMYGRGGADTFYLKDNDKAYGGDDIDLIVIDGNSSEYFIQSTSNFQWFEITRTVGDFSETFLVANCEKVQFNNATLDLVWTFNPFG